MSAPWRLSAAGKSTIATVLCISFVGLGQWALVSRGVAPAIAVAGPLLVAPLVAWVYTAYFVRYRTRALVTAFTTMAEGDLNAQLPPAPDAELLPVRAAFDRMGAALRDSTTRLRHADAQRRRLFADLAHELATPTGTILGISDALGTPALSATDTERAWLLASLDQEILRLVRFIGDVRDLAELDEPESTLDMRPVDVGALAVEATERLNRLDPTGARILCQAGAARALADAGRIDQVLMNLLANARRHAPADGTIAITVSRTDGGVRVVVEDSGAGVPDDLLPRLGERLFRADGSRARSTGGHGLGLSIVSAIVQRHRGTLRFERSDLGGLRVAVELPGE
jgi:signal transduction histidine kinase